MWVFPLKGFLFQALDEMYKLPGTEHRRRVWLEIVLKLIEFVRSLLKGGNHTRPSLIIVLHTPFYITKQNVVFSDSFKPF